MPSCARGSAARRVFLYGLSAPIAEFHYARLITLLYNTRDLSRLSSGDSGKENVFTLEVDLGVLAYSSGGHSINLNIDGFHVSREISERPSRGR